MPRVRCSPIWLRRWPTVRTVSTGSGSCAGIVSMCSGRRPRPPRCGGWSISASTPHTCQVFVGPARWRGRRRGPLEPLRRPVSPCISTSTPPWSSTIPTTRPTRRRPGKSRSVIIRCWHFWIARRSPGTETFPTLAFASSIFSAPARTFRQVNLQRRSHRHLLPPPSTDQRGIRVNIGHQYRAGAQPGNPPPAGRAPTAARRRRAVWRFVVSYARIPGHAHIAVDHRRAPGTRDSRHGSERRGPDRRHGER